MCFFEFKTIGLDKNLFMVVVFLNNNLKHFCFWNVSDHWLMRIFHMKSSASCYIKSLIFFGIRQSSLLQELWTKCPLHIRIQIYSNSHEYIRWNLSSIDSNDERKKERENESFVKINARINSDQYFKAISN